MKLVLLTLLSVFTLSFSFGQTANEYYLQSVEKANNGKFSAALKDMENAIKLDALNIDYYNSKAYLHYELEQFKEAYDDFSTAISIEPNSASYDGRALVLETVGQFEFAIEDYNMAVKMADNDTVLSVALSNRSAVKMKVRDFQSAYEDLMQAYEIDSTDLGVLVNLGAVCDEIGKGDETLIYLLKAIVVDPDFYPAYANIGYKFQQMGMHKKAIEFYDKVLEFNSDEPLGYSNRSFNYYMLGELKKAHKDIDKSLKIYSSNSYAHRVKALIYLKEGKPEKACEYIQNALELGFTDRYGDEVLMLRNKFCK